MSLIRFNEFDRLREEVYGGLDVFSMIAEEINQDSLKKRSLDVKEELADNSFLITVVGEFSRGKSTFINALLGEKVLPSLVRPTTAILNKITYNEEPNVKLVFHDGESPRQISVLQLKELNVPREPDESDADSVQEHQQKMNEINRIKHAEIGYPNSLFKAGVEIYDTPGVNDLDKSREDLTYHFIPRSDAVVLLLSAEMPLSESEKTFLKYKVLNKDISKVFIAVNFKDVLDGEHDVQRVRQHIETNLADLIKNPKVFMISSKEALQARKNNENQHIINSTGLTKLEESIGEFLENDRGFAKLLKPVKRGQKIAKELIHTLGIKVAACEMNTADIQKSIDELMPKVDLFIKSINHARDGLRSELLGEQTELTQAFSKNLFDLEEMLSEKILHYAGEINEDKIQKMLSGQMIKLGKNFEEKMEVKQHEIATKHLMNAYQRLEKESQEINNEINKKFNITLSLSDIRKDFDDSFELIALSTGVAFTAGIGIVLVPFLLVPLAIASFFSFSIIESISEGIKRRKLEKINQQFKANFRSTREKAKLDFINQWTTFVEETVSVYEKEANAKTLLLKEELASIKKIKELDREKILEKKTEFLNKKKRIENVQKSFAKIEKDFLQSRGRSLAYVSESN
ncbi:dynamin family protein [Jeotgalibacillus campisalis]|uniref:Dynamin N-terminal domain-containing protein n=1 Tax=Jeotgalibacillus campisalis TaxID=220754 RepID=A0A0C2V261_9BACL|nr:dynamin family protein [Jeotgalibacillus campisalis]KIL43137.1 hypothetical protein KR50_35400 [Jeotgalibacillus campisalis]